MGPTAYLSIILYVVAIVALVLISWGAVRIVAVARSAQRLADDMHATLPGLIEHADSTLTAVNAEVARVNGVVAQIEEVSGRVSSTTRAAQEIVEGPATAVSGLANGARRFFEVLFSSRS